MSPIVGAARPVRSATEAETEAVVATVVAAFVSDPVARFTWPTARAYLRGMDRSAHEFARVGIAHGSVFVADDLAGAALWIPPSIEPDNEALLVLLQTTADPTRLDDAIATYARMAAAHPPEPHWYLPLLGVDPMAQGRGEGGRLMAHATRQLDREGTLAYLESSNPRNVSLYERHGFEATDEIQEGSAPVVVPMRRAPR